MFKKKPQIRKRNLISRKASISYSEILILIISIFAFSFIISIPEVKAEDKNCCLENKQGAICQEYAGDCNSNCKSSCIPTSCSRVSSCKLGCCYDESEGLCTSNSPKGRCEKDGGNWSEDASCNIQDCQLGCCVLGQNVEYVTEKRCQKLAAFNGLPFDFKAVGSELECLSIGNSQAVGACVIEQEKDNRGIERGCKFNTKIECLQLGGSFFENKLCTSPELNTICEKTENTVCVEGKDEVYFVDSCGNTANIYDASKVDNQEYWDKVISKEESCGSNSASINSQMCGNCNRFFGSFCGEGKAEIGKYICKDLNCKDAPYMVDASGKILKSKDRVNGESWCVYDSYIGEGKDVVGSRHFKYYCLDGEVKVEGCSDYRQEICVENEVKGEKGDFSVASCRTNKWRECIDYNNLAEKQGEKINYDKMIEKCKENSDCYVKEFNFGRGYKFFQCLPNYPPGLELNSERGEELGKSVCSMANFECVKVEIKDIGGWVCVAGCDCDSKKFTQQMNDWCVSLGDCGGYVNIVGGVDDAYSVDKAPKIDLNQYKKYVNPSQGQKAEPGEIKDTMGMVGGVEGNYSLEDVGLGVAIGKVVAGKALELAAVWVTSWIGKGPSLTMAQAWNKLPLIGAKITVQNLGVGFGNQLIGGTAGSIAGYLVAKMFGLQGKAACFTSTVGAVAGSWAVVSGTQIAEGAAIKAGTTLTAGSSLGAGSGIGSGTVTSGTINVVITATETQTVVASQVAPVTISALQGGGVSVAGAGAPPLIGTAATAATEVEIGTGGASAGAGATAGAEGAGVPIFGIDPVTILIAIAIIILTAIILKYVFGMGDIRETKAHFTCYPWEAPTGGEDCEKCNSELKTCSQYRCSSLGQACGLVNPGTALEACIATKNDGVPPKISPWEKNLTEGYKYYDVSNNGFKVKTEKGECIPAYTPLVFGVSTDELSQCKVDLENKNFEEMQDYFGSDNLFKKEHSMPFLIPHPEAIANATGLTYEYILNKIGNIRLYVKCQDVNGNVNTAPYLIDICIKPGPDKTAPMIYGADPVSGSYVRFNQSKQDMTLYVNEPAECKYSLLDKGYDSMENNMSCLTGFTQASVLGWTCSASLPLNLSLSNFYFRCKDQPWLTGENESRRNVNSQSFVYELKKSNSELKIDRIEPNGTIVAGVEPFSVNLKVYTSGGAESGKADCSFRFAEDGSWIQFFDTFSSIHEQIFSQMLSGEHTIYVNCKDVAGNEVESSTTFKLNLDTKAPKVVRVYNSGMLTIITNEDAECVYSNENCNFVWENATKMTGLLREHETTQEQGKSYYIKCKDKYENKGNCFIVRVV